MPENSPVMYHGPADGVFEGGGIKGIALVGALRAASKYVTEWRSLAGTSGGAVVAAMLAAGYSADDLLSFLSGGGIPNVIDKFSLKDVPRRRSVFGLPYISEAVNLIAYMGMYSGDYFEELMGQVLEKGPKPIKYFGELKASAIDIAKGHPPYKLQFIATDLTHKKLLVIPQDLDDADNVPVARGVRMSMSIPVFFEPVIVRGKTEAEPPTVIVDGGVISNFPIWIFDSTTKAEWPTFGFLLDEKEEFGRRMSGIGPLGRYLIDTAMGGLNDALVKRMGKGRTITLVVKGFKTTDFAISDERREELLREGETKAEAFFQKFDASAYQNSLGNELKEETMEALRSETPGGAP